MDEIEYSYLKRKIRQLLNIDIDAYKSQQMRRRLESFVARREPGSAFRFCKALERDEGTLRELRDMLTINVSEFFRDSLQFEHLRSKVLPELVRRNPRLNIWAAGCSHGQEPYSVAILLNEISAGRRHRILATDVDVQAIGRATAGGPYLPADLKNIPEGLRQKYFRASDGGYAVVEETRHRVEFREHNLLSDEFEDGFDLVLCRNVMIYFSNEAKRTLVQRFHESLKPGGVLFIGGTESLLGIDGAGFERLFTNFYRKSEAVMAERRQERAA